MAAGVDTHAPAVAFTRAARVLGHVQTHPRPRPAPLRIGPGPSLPPDVSAAVHHPTGLESPWVWRLLLAATVGVVALWIVLAVRRRRARRGGPDLRRARRVWAGRIGAALSVLLLATATGAAAVNSYVGYVPSLSALRDLVSGVVLGDTTTGDTTTGGPATAGPATDDPGAGDPGADDPAAGAGRSDRPTPDRGVHRSAGRSGGHGSGGAASQASSPARVVLVRIGAPALHVPASTTYVYLPPGYDDPANIHRRYPVVYLLHGHPGRAEDWFSAGRAARTMGVLLRRRLVQPMIVVSPAANAGSRVDGACLDAVGGPQLETYLTDTVVRYVDSRFRTRPDRAHRTVGGMSSGGYCALNLGLRHDAEFSVILGIEPYGDPGDVRGSLLGGSRARYRENSPSQYIPAMRITRRVAVFLDAGGADRADVRRAWLLARQLARRGEEVALRVERGEGHTWYTARVGLPFMLVFASEHMHDSGMRTHRPHAHA